MVMHMVFLFCTSLCLTHTCSTHMMIHTSVTKFTQHGFDSLHDSPSFVDTLVYYDLHRSIMAQNLSGFLHGSGTDIAKWNSSSADSRPKNATAHSREEEDEDQILEESQWCTSHEDHNSQMHAIHGNTKTVKTTTPKSAPAKATPPAKTPATEKKQTAKEKAAAKKAAAKKK